MARTLDCSDQAAEDGDAANALTWLRRLKLSEARCPTIIRRNARHGDGHCVLIAPSSNTSRRDREHRERRGTAARRDRARFDSLSARCGRSCSQRFKLRRRSTRCRDRCVREREGDAVESRPRTFQRKVDRAERKGDADAARWHLWALGRSLYSAEVAVEALREWARPTISPPSPSNGVGPAQVQATIGVGHAIPAVLHEPSTAGAISVALARRENVDSKAWRFLLRRP